jgi:dipeptidyl aminopeptidase/acylaminoacyl peptidase
MRKVTVPLILLLLTTTPALAQDQPVTRTPFTARDLVALNRLSDPQVSADGLQVAYVLRRTDLAANRGRSDLYVLDLTRPGAAPRQLTTDAGNDSNPRWSPDGRSLYFLSTRSGSSQVWRLPMAGGEPQQVTRYPLDVNALRLSPDGTRIAISMDSYPECADLACNAARAAQPAANAASGRLYSQLFVRHWDRWEDGTLAQLYTAKLDAQGVAGEPVSLMHTLRANVPSRPDGGDEEFTFSPDSQRVVYAARPADRVEAWSTNYDLYEVAADGSGTARNLTADNPAWDTQPVFLADGSLAWLAMSRAGFEADRFRVMLRDARTGATRVLANEWDYSVGHLAASGDGRNLLATADDHGQVALFAIDVRSGGVTRLHGQGQVTAFAPARGGIVIALASLDAPSELFLLPARGGALQALSAVNQPLLAARLPIDAEQFSFTGADNAQVSGYVVKPQGYVAGQRYPIALLIHGGPQSAFGNAWSFRWNPKTFAGAGYAVVFIDFHGTPGYGQAFTDSISRDWGGKPLVDLQRGLAAALARYDFLDGDRACALGASYGGFMINWIAGNWSDRFRCLVNHDGIFDTRSMYYSTEELWFTEWENGGTYFDHPAAHEQFNPSAYVNQWRTPMLVIHGERDFRVPDTQGLATFTALQRRGIESRLLMFPNENHWVLKPANSLQWYDTVLDWLQVHLH